MFLLDLNNVADEISAGLYFGSRTNKLSQIYFVCSLRIVCISEIMNKTWNTSFTRFFVEWIVFTWFGQVIECILIMFMLVIVWIWISIGRLFDDLIIFIEKQFCLIVVDTLLPVQLIDYHLCCVIRSFLNFSLLYLVGIIEEILYHFVLNFLLMPISQSL